MRLNRTISPYDDEPLLSYAMRLSDVNHYESTNILHELAQFFPYKAQPQMFCSNRLNLNSLCELTGVSIQELQSLTYQEIAENRHRFCGTVVHRMAIKNWPAKVCPKCLEEKAYSRQIWDLAAYSSCAIHGVPLLSNCPKCNKRLSWKRPRHILCQCGYDLRRTVQSPVSEDESSVMQHIYNLVYQKDIPQGPLQHLSLESFLRLLDFMAAQVAGVVDASGNFLPQRPIDKVRESVIKAYSIFTNWPNNFYAFLNQVKERPCSRKYAGNCGLVKSFGRFYLPLYNTLEHQDFQFLREAFEDYLLDWDGGNIVAGDLVYSERFRERYRFMGRTETYSMLNMAPARVDRLLAAGFLTGTITPRNDNTLYKITKESVYKLKQEMNRALSVTQVKDVLGLNSNQVITITRAGLLKPFMGETVLEDDFEWLYLPEAVDELLAKVRAQVKPDYHCNELLSSNDVIAKLKSFEMGVKELIEAIIDGQVHPCGEFDGYGLQRFGFSPVEITAFTQKVYKEFREGDLDLQEATNLLRVKMKSLRLWLRKGLIKGITPKENGKRWWLISKEEISRFKDTYVLAAPIARYYRVSPEAFLRKLDAASIKPISGMSVDGGLQYLMIKKDLEHAGYETFPSWDTSGVYRKWNDVTKKVG